MTTQKHQELVSAPPEHCPGPESDTAGQSSACQGCPNQSICSSSSQPTPEVLAKKKKESEDLSMIKSRADDFKNVVLVLSGKGGVGKSTVCTQLAFAFARWSFVMGSMQNIDEESELKHENVYDMDDSRVGLLDADICGPSVPILTGIQNEIVHSSAHGWEPVTVYDDYDEYDQIGGSLSVMSCGLMLDNRDDAIIWRGDKKHGLMKQFLKDVIWGKLDWLFVDTPPGTSDEHLSIVQCLKQNLMNSQDSRLSGAILVTSPQELAVQDVRKEINFCEKVGIRVIGLVENMDGIVCPSCKKESMVFPVSSSSPAKKLCLEKNIPYLGSLPLDPRVTKLCDKNTDGIGFMELEPNAIWSQKFRDIILNITAQIIPS